MQGNDKCRHNLKGFVRALTFFLFHIFPCTSGINSDRLALLAFKSSISSDPYLTLSDWNERDQTPCNWSGVLCLKFDGYKNPRVVRLQLPQKGLAGSIPKELGNLTYLQKIDLQNNQLTGMLHLQLFDALSLNYIALSGNQLSGIIPANIGDLTDLRYINLGSNLLVGSIPDTITKCTCLVSLVLTGNALAGSIPYGIGSNLKLLQHLDLSSNSLSGSIPTDLGDLSSLQGTLNLSNNHLSGLIPATLGKLPVHVSIDLQQNYLFGPIPQVGRLINQGPTAFLGNTGLCGFPLKVECPTYPSEPRRVVQTSKQSRSPCTIHIVAIAVADFFGIAIVCAGSIYGYMRYTLRKEKENPETFPDKISAKNDGSSLRVISERIFVAADPAELVHFSKEYKFGLDYLLEASAYVLGKSGPAMIYKAVLEDGTTVAVRSLGVERDYSKEIRDQLQIMGHVCHPNVVHLIAYFWSVQEKLLVYDFKSNGNLATALQACRTVKGLLPWSKRLNIAKGVAEGLAYLHDLGSDRYVHGDLKPSKILLDENMESCIADFNLRNLQRLCDVYSADSEGLLCSGSRGYSNITEIEVDETRCFRSSQYQPPEALEFNRPTRKWDVYAFGVILLDLLTERSLPAKLETSKLYPMAWVDTSSQGSNFLDPLLERIREQHEMLEVLQVALICVAIPPEKRPRMKHVAESLQKIGCSSSKKWQLINHN